MLMEGLPVLDTGSFGESCGSGADSEACEGPQLPAGAAAAEDPGPAERPADQ